MAVPSPAAASLLALAANAFFFWLAPYLTWKREPSKAYAILARGIALCGLVHHLSFFCFQGVNLLLLEGYRPCEFLSAASEHLPPPALYLRFPTLLWLGDSCDPLVLSSVVALGAFCSALALLGIAAPLAFMGQYLAVLSLGTVGGQVLMYPWDILICEASFLAVWLPPSRTLGELQEPPPRLVRWAFALLLLKTLGMSGIMKFYDNRDSAWADWSYMRRYLEWQGFPTWAALVAFHAPEIVHHVLHCYIWLSQVLVPLLLLAPVPRLRRVLALAVTLEMQGIQLLGNYGIFNALTAVLALPYLALPCGECSVQARSRWAALHRAVGSVVCAILMPLGCFHVLVYLATGNATLSLNPQGQPEYLWSFPRNAGALFPAVRVMGRERYEALAAWLQEGWWPHALRLAAVWRVANTVGVFRGHPAGRHAFTISLRCGGGSWHEVVPPHAAPQHARDSPAAVYTHNGMFLSPFVGYSTHVFGDFYHKLEATLLPALILGLLSDCCADQRSTWGPWAMLTPAALPPECADSSGIAAAPRTGEPRAAVHWHRYHVASLTDLLRGGAPFTRGPLLAAVSWTQGELATLVRGAVANATELLRSLRIAAVST